MYNIVGSKKYRYFVNKLRTLLIFNEKCVISQKQLKYESTYLKSLFYHLLDFYQLVQPNSTRGINCPKIVEVTKKHLQYFYFLVAIKFVKYQEIAESFYLFQLKIVIISVILMNF